MIFFTILYLVGLIFLRCFQLCGCCIYKPSAESRFSKTTRERCAITCSFLYMVLLLLIIALGYFRGSTQLLSFMPSVVEAPSGFADIARKEVTPINNIFSNVISSALVPTLLKTNSTLNKAINFHHLYEDLVIVNESVAAFPDIEEVSETATAISYHIDNISSVIDLISQDVDDLETTKATALENLNVLQNDLIEMNDTVFIILGAVRDSVPLVEEVGDAQTSLLGDVSVRSDNHKGSMGAVYSDLETLNSENDIVRNYLTDPIYPSAFSFTDLADGSYASVTTFLNGDMDGSSGTSERSEFIADLQALYDIIVSKPNYTLTAQSLADINRTVQSLPLPILKSNVEIVELAIANATTNDTLISHLNDLLDTLNSITLDPIGTHIDQIIAQVDFILGYIDWIADQVVIIGDAIPPLLDPLYDVLVTQPRAINRTIYNLDSILKLDGNETFETKYFGQVNETIYKVLDAIAKVHDTIDDARESIDSVNSTEYLAKLSEVEEVLRDQVEAFNSTKVIDLFNSIGDKMSPDFSAFTSNIDSLSNAIDDTSFGTEIYDLLDGMQALNVNLTSQLVEVIASLQKLEQGVCSGDTAVYCGSDSDCSVAGGSCGQIGEYRCEGTGSAPVSSCSSDNDCSATSGYCLADSVRMVSLGVVLNIYGNANGVGEALQPNSTSLVLRNLRDVREGGNFDIQPTLDDLTDTMDSLEDLSVADYIDDLDVVKDGINDVDLSSIDSSLDSANSTISDVNFDDFIKQIDDAEKYQDKATKYMSDALTLVHGVIDFFFVYEDGLGYYADQLAANKLENILTNGGSSNMIFYVSDNLQAVATKWVKLIKPFSKSLKEPNMTKIFRPFARVMDILNSQPGSKYEQTDQHGSLYFLLNLDQPTARKYLAPVENNENGYVQEDADEKRYEDQQMCLTRECFENEQERTQNAPLSPMLPAQATFLNVASIVWVPLAIVFLLSLWTLCCPHVCCRKNKKTQYHPATFMLCVMICVMPWYLILPGLGFPMVLLMADGCNSYRDIGVKAVNEYGKGFCDTAGGKGDAEACFLKNSFINVTVDMTGIATSILGDCSGADAISVPMRHLANQLTSAARIEEYLAKKTFKDVRPDGIDVVRTALTTFGDVGSDFIIDNADYVFTCEGLAAAVENLDDPLCVHVVGSLGWFIGMLYLAGWAMFCCGIPTACCVQHNTLWLYHEEENMKIHALNDAIGSGLDEDGNPIDEDDELDEIADGERKPKSKGDNDEDEGEGDAEATGDDVDLENPVVALPYVYGKSNVHYHAELTTEDADKQHAQNAAHRKGYENDDDEPGHVELTRHSKKSHQPTHKDEPHHIGRGKRSAHADDEGGEEHPLNHGKSDHSPVNRRPAPEENVIENHRKARRSRDELP